MKKSIILLAALMISSIIYAQPKAKHPQRDGSLEKIKNELGLDDVQYASIKGINKKYGQQISALRKDSLIGKNEQRAKLKNLRGEKEKEIKAVLTTDQKSKYEKLRQERIAKRQNERKMRAEEQQVKMSEALSLSPQQVLKVNEARDAFKKKVKALRDQSTESQLNDKANFKQLRKEHESAMQSILTADQFAKWEAMRKDKQFRNGKKNVR